MNDSLIQRLRALAARPEFPPAILFLAALILRFAQLGERSLWNDELFTLQLSSAPLSALQSSLTAHFHHPPFFFFLTHLAVALFGATAWAIRFPSAVAGALTIPILYLIGVRLNGRRTGWIAALLCLIAPFHLAYSQEGRPYALAAMLCLLSFYAFLRYRESRAPLDLVLYIGSTILLLYTHHWGVFAVAAEALALLLLSTDIGFDLRTFAIPFAAVALLYVPEISSLRQQSGSQDAGGWFWVERAGFVSIGGMLLAYAGSYFKLASALFDAGELVRWLSGILTGVFFVIAVWDLRDERNERFRLLALLTALFLLLPILASLLKPELFVWYRFPVIAFPAIALLGAFIASARPWRLSLGALALALQLYGTVLYGSFEKGNAKAVAAYVDSVAVGDNAMIIRPKEYAPLLDYYLRGTATELDEAYLNGTLGTIVDTARGFVYVSLDVPNDIRRYMDGHFVRTGQRVFPGEAHLGIVVGVYKQPPDTDAER